MYHLRQEFPTSGVWCLMIWGGADVIMIEIKWTINAMCLNHPETIPPPDSINKVSSTKLLPDAKKIGDRCLKKSSNWKFPGCAVVRTLHFCCQWPRYHPWVGNEDPAGQVAWPKKKKKKKKNRNPLTDSISQNCAALDSALPTTTLKTSLSSSLSAASWRPPCTVWVSLAARVGGQERLTMTDEVSCI